MIKAENNKKLFFLFVFTIHNNPVNTSYEYMAIVHYSQQDKAKQKHGRLSIFFFPYLYSRRSNPASAIEAMMSVTSRGGLPRMSLFEDRTACHADHVGDGLDRKSTAAVGVLKAVQAGKK